MSLLGEALKRFKDIAEKHNLFEETIHIRMRTLKPEEAIGKPEREDYPLLKGKEVLIEATFRGARGQAFTDEPSNFSGTIEEILSLPLSTSRNRAIVVATINTVMRYTGAVSSTVHCRDEEPEECAREMSERFFKRWGEELTIGMVGLQPAIATALIRKFGHDHVQISDLDRDNIGKKFEGVTILDGSRYSLRVVENNFLALVSGSTVVNGTIDEILKTSRENNRNRIVIFYGVTISGVSELMNLKRVCFKAH